MDDLLTGRLNEKKIFTSILLPYVHCEIGSTCTVQCMLSTPELESDDVQINKHAILAICQNRIKSEGQR